MFKKNISVSSSRPLSGKDIKKFKKDVTLQFPDVTEDDLAELFPPKAEVVLHKLSNRASMYGLQGENPLFFDLEGRGEVLVPSVYALWKVPHMLDALYTYSEVSPKVLGGADLFLQGLIVPPEGLGQFAAGDVRAVAIPENPFPFAVGTLEVGSADVARTGLKGKGLRLLHYYGDQLWALGNRSIPDPGFTPTRIFPQGGPAGSGTAQAIAFPGDDAAQGVAALTLEADANPESVPAVDKDVDSATAEPPASGPDPAARGGGETGTDSQDSLVEQCLFKGLHSVSDGELPIQTSDFYSKHMLPAKAPGANVDIKKSSYKKLSALLKKYEKKGLLTTKQVHKQDNISSINRTHELYLEAETQAGQSGNSGATQGSDDVKSPQAGNGGGAASAGPRRHIRVTYCYRAPSSLRPIFGEGAAKDDLYTEEQCSAALRAYGEREGLLPDTSAVIKLDKLLVGGLFNKKEPQAEGHVHPLDDTLRRLLGKLQLHHRIERPSDKGTVEVVRKGTVKNVVIALEDRQGGRKHITRVTHVESFAIDPGELAGLLQRKFQTSSSVVKLPGKQETDKEIALQGNLLMEVSRFLAEEYGLDPSHIDIKQKGKP